MGSVVQTGLNRSAPLNRCALRLYPFHRLGCAAQPSSGTTSCVGSTAQAAPRQEDVVEVFLPGAQPEDISISVMADTLTIRYAEPCRLLW